MRRRCSTRLTATVLKYGDGTTCFDPAKAAAETFQKYFGGVYQSSTDTSLHACADRLPQPLLVLFLLLLEK